MWITGGSSGIGEAFARLIDGRVAHAAISARSADKLGEIAGPSASIRDYPVDVADAAAVKSVAAAIEAQSGPIDLAILNAGTWDIVKLDAFDPAIFRRSMDVNYQGVVNGIAAVLPGMLERASGHIAIVSSIAGYRGLPKAAAYGPTKAALINLVEALRPELEARGVKISLISPGFIETPLTANNNFPMPFLMPVEKAAERMLEGLVAGRYEVIFPRRLAYAMKLLRVLPNAAFFWFVRNFIFKNKR